MEILIVCLTVIVLLVATLMFKKAKNHSEDAKMEMHENELIVTHQTGLEL